MKTKELIRTLQYIDNDLSRQGYTIGGDKRQSLKEAVERLRELGKLKKACLRTQEHEVRGK